MIIKVASLTLRFYKRDGWNKLKIKKLLVNPKMKITFRKGTFPKLVNTDYYAVYGIAPNKTDYKIFKKSEMDKHTFAYGQFIGKSEIDWYFDEHK